MGNIIRDGKRPKWAVTARNGRGANAEGSDAYLQWLLVDNFRDLKSAFDEADVPTRLSILMLLGREDFFEAPFLAEMHLNVLTDE